jgi:RNA-directed DNA polymerase
MLNGHEKSDPAIVARKPRNKAERSAAVSAEPRAGAKGNADQPSTLRAQDRERGTPGLDRIRQAARQKKEMGFTSLLHHVDVDSLREAFYALERKAAPGVDGVTWEDYEADLERKLSDLCDRVHRGGPYHPLPARRGYIPKSDGKQRPLAIAALDDKIVQRAVQEVLSAIYEEDFLGFSYGLRPGRSQHDALDALGVAISGRKVNHILDADIRSFFDTVNQDWLIRFLEHRIGDKRIIRLIRKWLKAGVLEDGLVTVGELGTGQGSVISPLLSNVYLHHVIDLWAKQWREREEAKGEMIIVRYADDLVLGFEREAEARSFLEAMRQRLEAFGLSLHPEKTRIIEFGRHAAARRAERGLGKPETFNFLGFTFICGKTRKGRFLVKRKTRGDRMKARLKQMRATLRRRRHAPIPEVGKWLAQGVRGYLNYHAVPTNSRAIHAFRRNVVQLWRRALNRRGNRGLTPWSRMVELADDYLPRPRILHRWPEQNFAVKHPRWEPYAGKPHVRICAGGAQQCASLPRLK